MKPFLRQIFKKIVDFFDFDIDWSWLEGLGDWSGFFQVVLWIVGGFCWIVTALFIFMVIKMFIDELRMPAEEGELQ